MRRGTDRCTIPTSVGGGPFRAALILSLPILVSAWVVNLNSGPSSFRTRTRLDLSHNNDAINNNNNNNDSNSASAAASITLDTALAVIPPDEAWDRLQRARHVAHDRSYSVWPPAIRLFHPFVDSRQLHDEALRVAEIVDEYDVRPFAVTLSQWSIVPHQEAMEAHFRSLRQLPEQHSSSGDAKGTKVSKEEQEVLDLIANEERIGREKMKQRRKQRQHRLQEEQGVDGDEMKNIKAKPTSAEVNAEIAKKKRVKQKLDQQTAEQHEFNGPCVICLEPDEASQEHLQALRHLLKCELGPQARDYADMYSPTASLPLPASATGGIATSNDSTNNLPQPPSSTKPKRNFWRRDKKDDVDDDDDDDATLFRPLVPIAAFPTVSSAIPVARKLRKLWEPLTFNVTDLQLLSCRSDAADLNVPSPSQHNNHQVDGLLQEYYGRYQQILHQDSSHGSMAIWEEELQVTSEYTNNGRCSRQFGCDALVSLVGEEVEMDSELNESMARLIWEQGVPGGHVSNQDNLDDNQHELPAPWDLSGLSNNNNDEDKEEGMRSDLEQWLFQGDEEFDEGTVVVIGRTHFFTGEMRKYVGMPASSALDAQDRTVDSAVARRKKGPSALRFDDGDFGTKTKASAK